MERDDDAFTPGRPDSGRDAGSDEARAQDGSGGGAGTRDDRAPKDAAGAAPDDDRPVNRNLIYNNREKWRIA
ncbi:MAG: hypothetical protein ACOCUN_03635, partial [Jiangellaceae bacterium]